MPKIIIFCTAALLFFVLPAKTQNFVFAQLKGSPMNTTGWNLQGAAKVTNVTGTGDQELLLVPTALSQSGAIFYNQPINLSQCSQWKAEFDFRMYDGDGGDGMAFCFLDVPPAGFVSGAGLGIPSSANGLKVCFDTWNNCNSDYTYEMPKVELRWGVGYSECSQQPTAANLNGQLSFIRSPSYAHAVIAYDDGNISVTVGSLQVITGFQKFDFTGYLGFTSSTGGFYDNQSIKNVVIYTKMPPSSAGTSVAVCPGDTAQLGTANDTAYTYSWSPAAGLSSTSVSNPYAVAGSNTTGSILNQKYYVQTSFKSTTGCTSEDSVVLQVNPPPVTDFDVPVVCLPNGSVTINNTTAINDGTQSQIKYNWVFSDGGISTLTNPPHNYPTPGNYKISLAAVSSNGCASEADKTFTVYPQAKASITLPPQFCADSAMAFKGGAGGLTVERWNWSFGDGGIDSVQNPSHSYGTPKIYTVTLSAVTSQGCLTDTPSATITVNPLPIAAFSYAGLDCTGQLLHFTDVSQPSVGTITARNWVFDDGSTSTAQTVDHGFSQYGTHNVTLTVQNAKGCLSKPDTGTVTINAAPVANFGPPLVCVGSAGVFTDSTTIADGSQGQLGLQWFFGDGATGIGSNPAHNYASAGYYTAQLVATSANGCADSVSKTFAVSSYPVVDFNILTTDFCGNLPLQLKDSSGVAFGILAGLTIFWNSPASADSTYTPNPMPGTVYTHNYATFGYTNSQQVNVTVRAYAAAGCYTQTSGSSILLASPKLVFSSLPTLCANNTNPILLNEAADTSAFAGSGTYTGAGVGNGYFTPSAAGAGVHTITYTYTLVNGCTDTVQQIINVATPPTVSAGQQIIILSGGQTTLQGAASGGDNLVYAWQPGASLNDSMLLQPLATPATDTYYTLTATNGEGCIDTAGVWVKVLQSPLVPNAFSPNGDGINDTWQIAYLSSYPDCVVNVFNRYGQLLYHSQGYQTPWDGTYNGKPAPVGTYYYVIATSHLPKPLTGPVTILR